MKKTYVGMLVLAVSLLGLTSCKVSTDQIKMIANAVGLFSSVTWVAVDNPPMIAKQGVITVLTVVSDSAQKVSASNTYTEVIYPLVVTVIDTQVAAQYRPLCKAGTAMLLGQLDLLFASHPEWKTNQDIALDVTVAFCTGAEQGLLLSDTDPIIVQAKKNATLRLSIKK